MINRLTINDVRTKTLKIIDKMDEPFDDYWEECVIILFMLAHLKILIVKDEVSKMQLNYMLDSKRNLVAGLFKKWRLNRTLTSYFINEVKPIINEAFDIIGGKRYEQTNDLYLIK